MIFHKVKDELFYVGQKAFIQKDNKLLVLIDPLYGIDLPGGKIQVGESDLRKSFLRELHEEVGIEVEIGNPFQTWIWDLKDGEGSKYDHQILLIGYLCKYISGNIKLSQEHSRYYWIGKDTYKEILKNEWNDNATICKVIENYFNQ